jgi:hypothetical protein
MGRPKLEIRRDRQFNLGLTADEFAQVLLAARLASMRPVDYGRMRLLSKPKALSRTALAVHQLDPLLLAQLGRIGSNLNQVTRRLHMLAVPEPEELGPVLFEIRALLREAQRG